MLSFNTANNMSAYDKKPVFLIALALLAACTSCGHDDPDVPPTPIEPPTPDEPDKPTEPDKPDKPDEPAAQIPINVSATITRATEEAFESGDRMGLFVVNRNADGSAATLKPLGNHLDNMPYTYTTTWNAEKTAYWKDAQTHADFYMYYPYTQTVASVSAMPFSVSADQSTLDAYKSSDLIVGSTLDAAPTASPVNIAARHLMSQVEIVVKAGAGYSESSLAAADVSVTLNNLATSATVDLATSTVSADRTARSLTPYKDGAVYRAFVVPQTATGNNLITITVDGTDYNISKTVTFVGGKRHTLTATLSKEGGGLSVSISAWESDGVDYGGAAS